MGKEPMGKYSRYNNKNVQNVFEKTFEMPILIDIKQRISKRNFYKKIPQLQHQGILKSYWPIDIRKLIP